MALRLACSGLPLRLGLALGLTTALAQPMGVGALAPSPVVRVLLQEAPSLDLAASGPTSLRLEDSLGRTLLEVRPGDRVLLRGDGSGFIAELLQGDGRDRQLSLAARELWVEAEANGGLSSLVMLRQHRYRGRLQVRASGEALQAINHVDLESYLTSVVGSEMPASWPLAALRAQAVAARTYALTQRRPSSAFDLQASVASQMYKGVEAETDSTREAVASTRAQVLMHGNGLINAVFHSSSGGMTENSGELWSRQLPYLVSVPDFDENSPMRQWEKRFDPGQLRQSFPETGGVNSIDVLLASSSGRIRQARVNGPSGSLVLTGTDLRKRLGLRSTMVRFQFQLPGPVTPTAGPPPPPPLEASVVDSASGSGGPPAPLGDTPPRSRPSSLGAAPILVALGHGFGHGVGMSQWGAYGMAQRGQDYAQILSHYYRGAELRPFALP